MRSLIVLAVILGLAGCEGGRELKGRLEAKARPAKQDPANQLVARFVAANPGDVL